VANVALRVAPHRVATNADCEARLNFAMHIALTGQTGARGSAAIAVGRA
jgi:hypothetical protein